MTESQAREVLLLRAFETPFTTPWSEAEAARCGTEALRLEGESAEPERWLARRAALGTEWLAERQRGVREALALAAGHPGAGWLLVALAGFAGIAVDALGGSRRINILAPPLLALLAWNLAVYAALVLAALRRPWPAGWGSRIGAWLKRRATPRHWPAPIVRFVSDWAWAAAPLHAARAAKFLHAAAATLALGAIASMYLRGLAFEFRAGWESTFLSAERVHDLLALVLGPATLLSGTALPGVDELEALRFSLGPGEIAARWIHWYAITLALVVILPRAALAALAARRSRGLAAAFPLPPDDAYFGRLALERRGEETTVRVLPYSYHATPAALAALEGHLRRTFGPRARMLPGPVVPLGGEDDLPALLGALPAAPHTVALFALTATPERETHGAFVQALAAREGTTLQVLVDESGFRARLAGAENRVAERREAWRKMLSAIGHVPVFVDLSR